VRNEESSVDSFTPNPLVDESNNDRFPDGTAEHPGSSHEVGVRALRSATPPSAAGISERLSPSARERVLRLSIDKDVLSWCASLHRAPKRMRHPMQEFSLPMSRMEVSRIPEGLNAHGEGCQMPIASAWSPQNQFREV
jgi:hypothetical protein